MSDTTPREELAWAAGFFDGEGYVATHLRWVNGKQYRRLGLQINQIDPEVLARFREAVGVGYLYGPYEARNRPNPVYKYGVSAVADVTRVVELLTPFLSSIKAKQAAEALRIYHEMG